MMEKLYEILVRLGFLQARGIYYIGGSDILPPPLKGEQEQQALEALEQGDESAKQLLIEHNLRLVAHIVKKYYSAFAEQDDLISIGTIGLIKAVETFKADKGIRLATYAARCIENATLSQMSFWLRKELPIGELPSRLRKICI